MKFPGRWCEPESKPKNDLQALVRAAFRALQKRLEERMRDCQARSDSTEGRPGVRVLERTSAQTYLNALACVQDTAAEVDEVFNADRRGRVVNPAWVECGPQSTISFMTPEGTFSKASDRQT